MPKQLSSPDASWTIEDLYNFVMVSIDPDLVLGRLEELDTIYENETAQERTERTERYMDSFETCFAIMEELLNRLAGDLDAFKRTLLSSLKGREADERGAALETIVHSLDNE